MNEICEARKQTDGTMSDAVLLHIEDLHTVFDTYEGVVQALAGITVDFYEGTITGLVGETGCGKSVTAKSIMRLIKKPGRIVSGQIKLLEEDLLQKTESEMSRIRGKTIAMIFQNARAALNPLFTIEQQLRFVLKRHAGMHRNEIRSRSIELLKEVGLSDPERRLRSYPSHLSSGMCQRAMIALALSCRPRFLIADEPTTGLDVTIEAQVLELFSELVYTHHSTAILITHDLAVVSETCDYTAVMYAGHVVEFGPTEDVFAEPLHPYTQGLLNCCLTDDSSESFRYIPGTVPSLITPPPGCRFAPRCPVCTSDCEAQTPKLVEVESGHFVACVRFLYE